MKMTHLTDGSEIVVPGNLTCRIICTPSKPLITFRFLELSCNGDQGRNANGQPSYNILFFDKVSFTVQNYNNKLIF